MDVQEYLIFEKENYRDIQYQCKLENRKKFNVTEKDIEEFYGKVNKKRKKKKIKEKFTKEQVREQLELFKRIFDDDDDAHDSYVNIRCRTTGEYYAYNVKSILTEYKLYNILNSDRFSTKNDLMYTLNLFNNMKRLNEDNIFTLFTIAIDVDFKETKKYANKKPKDIIKILEKTEFGKTIPTPNIIEYSNNLRLIYTFNKVYKTYKACNLVKKIARVIGERLSDFHANAQPLSTYGRIICSNNSKTNDTVKVMYLNVEKYKLLNLANNVLEPLSSWRPEYKTKTKRKVIDLSTNFKGQARYAKNNQKRIDDFFRIQKFYNYNCDGRRFMCFQVRNHAILAGYSSEEAREIMRTFNDNFKYPLRWNVIDSDTKNLNRKQYYYKSQTILDILGIEPEEEALLELKGIVSEIERKRRDNKANKERQKKKYRNKEGLTNQEIARRNDFIIWARMELEGNSYKEIARKLGYTHHNRITRKINKKYDRINYIEILEEVKNDLKKVID